MPHSFTVGPATTDDLPAIQELHRALCLAERASGYDANADPFFAASPSGRAYLSARISGNGLALIARQGENGIVGFLLAGVRSEPRGSVSGLESMFVVPAARRLGIGTALLEQFLTWHRASSLPFASLAVAPANRAAIALYQKAGFTGTTLVMERASSARAHNSEA
jgi:ribosomal protein S18 acetylase RimI-like enzyme